MARKIKSRYDEGYLYNMRNTRLDSYQAWKNRIAETDSLVKGEFPAINGMQPSGQPAITNIADQFPRDVARLAAEAKSSIRAATYEEGVTGYQSAQLRKVIAEGYFDVNAWDVMQPQLVMDAVLAGAMFVVAWADSTRSEYPLFMRVDPRNCYPDIWNGEMLDLLVVTTMPIRTADRLFPELRVLKAFDKDEETPDTCEVYDYYTTEECVKAIGITGMGGELKTAKVAKVWVPETDRVPAAMFKVPSPDGSFRGLIDQIGGSLAAKDKLTKDALEYSHQMVYSPWEESGIMNPTTVPGPDVVYHHDPQATNPSFMRRTSPAQMNPQVFAVLDNLDNEIRGQVGYPATRQGDVQQSQGSASFVTSTQGQLTSIVREVQRGLTVVQQQIGSVSAQLDKAHLAFEKPLFRAIGRKKSYNPESAFDKGTRIFVTYGAGAGLDRLNADTRLLQYHAAGVLPAKRMLGEIDFVEDPEAFYSERQDEELERVVMQRFAGDPSSDLEFIMRVLALKRSEGLSFVEAYTAILELQSPQVQQEPAAGPLSPDAGTAEAEGIEGQQRALESGQATQAAPVAPSGGFTPLPMQQAFVKEPAVQ